MYVWVAVACESRVRCVGLNTHMQAQASWPELGLWVNPSFTSVRTLKPRRLGHSSIGLKTEFSGQRMGSTARFYVPLLITCDFCITLRITRLQWNISQKNRTSFSQKISLFWYLKCFSVVWFCVFACFVLGWMRALPESPSVQHDMMRCNHSSCNGVGTWENVNDRGS